MSIELVMPSNHLILCCPPLLLPSIFPSIRIFFNESVLRIRWPKCWSFSFSISPSNEYSGLLFFRTNWFDLLAVQGALKSLLQHHNLKASILQHSAFFMVQFLHTYMTTGKTIALTMLVLTYQILEERLRAEIQKVIDCINALSPSIPLLIPLPLQLLRQSKPLFVNSTTQKTINQSYSHHTKEVLIPERGQAVDTTCL